VKVGEDNEGKVKTEERMEKKVRENSWGSDRESGARDAKQVEIWTERKREVAVDCSTRKGEKVERV
jgi:hypothetical protein